MATVPKDADIVSHSTSTQESSASSEVKEDGTEISQSSFKKEESETKIQQSSDSFSSTSVKSSSVKMTSSSSTSSTSGNLAIAMSPTDDLLLRQDDFMQKALSESQDRFLQQQQQMMQQMQSQEVSQVMQKKVVGMSSSKMVVQESVEEEQGPPVGALDANGNQVEAARPEAGGGDLPPCPTAPTTSMTTTSTTSESVHQEEASAVEEEQEEAKAEEQAVPTTIADSMTMESHTSATEVTSAAGETSGDSASTEVRSHTTEIEQESIKNTLREIISEIEEAVVSEVMTSESAEKSESKEEEMADKVYYQAIVSNSESTTAPAVDVVTESTKVDVTEQLRQETSRLGYEEVSTKSFSPPRFLQTPSAFIKSNPAPQIPLPPLQQLPPLEDLDAKIPPRLAPGSSKTLPRTYSSTAASKSSESSKEERRTSLTQENLMHLWQSVQIAHELNQVLGGKANGPVPNGEVKEEAKDQEVTKTEETIETRSEKVDEESSSSTTITRESVSTMASSQTKHIDLEKLFTPADDSGENTPLSRNRKMYSSSSFYLPSHPTVEEQVDLARRISRSLADSSNMKSKGQSMYVNRKKRSVKWVHEGSEAGGGGGGQAPNGVGPETPADDLSFKIPQVGPQEIHFKETRSPLKLVMNPRGQIQDLASLRRQGIPVDPGPISPEVVFDLVKDLNSPRGRGAELFAKRRKRSENWVVDETTVKSSSSSMMMESQSMTKTTVKQTPPPSAPLPLPSYLDHKRVEHIQKMDQIQERFTQPKLRLVKSPWEAALETGSVDAAFQEMKRTSTFGSTTAAEVAETVVQAARAISPLPFSKPAPSFPHPPPATTYVPPPAPTYIPSAAPQRAPQLPPQMAPQMVPQQPSTAPFGTGRDDLYRPKAPRGWTPTAEARYSAPAKQQQRQEHPLPPPPEPQMTAAPMQPSLLSNLNNYNTAPRGWNKNIDYYRPVTFASKV